MNKLDIVFDVNTEKSIPIDLDEIIKSRALFQANSGGGKSYILRKFLEKSHGKVQQIIIDPEGEFKTLREKFDYLLVSKEDIADIQLNVSHAALLARKLMESGASAIIDLYELNPFDRIRFVKLFVDALVNLPKNLWHPCIVVIDEIHTFAPEQAKGNSESLQAVADLASRGRKRGYALIGATQKLSKFHKDVAAELNTKFTGRCVLDIDQKRAAAELGIKDYTELRNLKYEFYAFGPAISGTPTLVKSYEVETEHEDIGSSKVIKVASPDKIKKMMESFKDLPQQAEQELRTVQDYQKKIQELNLELRQAKSSQSQTIKIDPAQIQRAENNGYSRGWNDGIKELEKIKPVLQTIIPILEKFEDVASDVNKNHSVIMELRAIAFRKFETPVNQIIKKPEFVDESPNISRQITHVKPVEQKNTETIPFDQNEVKLGLCERQCLIALQQRGGTLTKQKLSIITCYSNSSGGFNNAVSKIKTSGCVTSNGDELTITELGQKCIQGFDVIPDTPDAIMERWLKKLELCPGKILEYLYKFPHSWHAKQNIGEATGYSPTSGGFNNGISRLNSLGLITKDSEGRIRLTEDILF